MEIKQLFLSQKNFFEDGETLTYDFRVDKLKQLRASIHSMQNEICDALKSDLGKPESESIITEVMTVIHELDFHIKHLKKWMKPQRVPGSLLTFPSRNLIYKQPFGVSLILGAWNYPFHLTIMPLIGAISAGNTSILKPSELAPATSKLIANLVSGLFKSNYISVVEGGVSESQELLKLPFNKIFYTGGTQVGKIVMKSAADHLTPVTLELGGKSPAVIHHDADLQVAAKRIWWGKCINAGQTCVAPDYVLIHASKKNEFLELSKKILHEFYPNGFVPGVNYTRIINERHFDRINGLIKDLHPEISGINDKQLKLITPVLVSIDDWEHPVMQEEIFGPILPVLTYTDTNDLKQHLKKQPNPLAFYIFSENKSFQKDIISSIPFGGGCVNDTITHLGNPHLPFGGIGNSGMGNYHGKGSFEVFSHSKSVLQKASWPDPSLRYPPYDKLTSLIKKYLI